MLTSRRLASAAAGASPTSLEIAEATGVSPRAGTDPDIHSAVAGLVQRSAQANAALMRGDVQRWEALAPRTHDFTLMSPFGGPPTKGSELSTESVEAMGQYFKNGTFGQELVEAYGSPDMVVLALIERTRVEVGGLPLQDWPLRVTLVYRREGSDWLLAHRHADPLVAGISLEQAAALARGAPARPPRQ